MADTPGGVDLAKATVEERFWAKVQKTETCWLWTAKIWNGYGRFKVDGHTVLVHRFVYQLSVGRIPDGYQIDHLCRVRHCVNPIHLEPVTQRENVLRGKGFAAVNARKTHCKRGHPFDKANTILGRGPKPHHRTCRACLLAWYADHKNKAAPARR